MKATYRVLQDEILLKKYTDPVTLWFFGDVHRDTIACDVDRWKWFLKTAKDTMDENTYFICMGDTHDFASTREKRYLSAFPEVHGTTQRTFDFIAEKNNREFASEVSFMKGRLYELACCESATWHQDIEIEAVKDNNVVVKGFSS